MYMYNCSAPTLNIIALQKQVCQYLFAVVERIYLPSTYTCTDDTFTENVYIHDYVIKHMQVAMLETHYKIFN